MRKHWKAVVIVGTAIAVSGIGYFIIANNAYQQWRLGWLLNTIRSIEEKESRQEILNANRDTLGGFTPEETLTLYIRAIEERDYAAASGYFILDKQEMEFRNFLSANEYDLQEYLELIKKPHQGEFSEDAMFYTARYQLSGPDFFARFRKYPNQRWKIIEI